MGQANDSEQCWSILVNFEGELEQTIMTTHYFLYASYVMLKNV